MADCVGVPAHCSILQQADSCRSQEELVFGLVVGTVTWGGMKALSVDTKIVRGYLGLPCTTRQMTYKKGRWSDDVYNII